MAAECGCGAGALHPRGELGGAWLIIEGYVLDPIQILLGVTYQDDYEFPGAHRLELYLFVFALCFVWGIHKDGE